MNQPDALQGETARSEQFARVAMIAKTERVEADLSKYFTHLGRMSAQLTQTSEQIESSVVTVCQSFQEIAVRAKATVAMGRNFLGKVDGDDSAARDGFEELVQRCGQTLVKVLNITELSSDVSRRAVERVEQMDRASQKITRTLEQLEEIASGNRIMALNARIEAAHVGEKGAGFAIVAVEVAKQSERSQQVTSQVSHLVEELRSLATSTLVDLNQGILRDQMQVERCRVEVDNSLEDLRAAHESMKQTLANISSDGEILAKDINMAIRSMQFQDRVSQRIAHVVQDLDTLQTQLGGCGGSKVEFGSFDGKAFSAYTMREERLTAGMSETESAAGDVELF